MLKHVVPIALAAGMGTLAFAAPASATLQVFIDVSGTVITCAATQACNTSGSLGEIQLATTTVNGVRIQGEFDASQGNPTTPGSFFESSSVLTVINQSGAHRTVNVVVGDTDFAGPIGPVTLSGSGTWQATNGSQITMNWFYDVTNTQGANGSGNTPGVNIGTFTATASPGNESFAYTNTTPVASASLFSFTEQSTYDLAPLGRLVGRNQVASAIPAVPELSTWAMMLLGFGVLGFVGARRSLGRVTLRA